VATPYRRVTAVELDAPVLVVFLDGWIDAGLGAASAMAHLLAGTPTDLVASFDADQFVDFRDRRPVVRISNGLLDELGWPEIELRAWKDRAGLDVLSLVGPEPDLAWRTFVASVVELGQELGVRLAITLGAFPLSVPHTRPVKLVATAPNPASLDLAERVGVVRGAHTLPAPISAALLEGLGAAGITAVGLWARVPHYAAAMPYPAASAALVDGLASVAGLDLDSAELHAAAGLANERIDGLIAGSEEHSNMVRALEEAVDAEQVPPPFDPDDLPSGDEIGAELERFLRGETGTTP
jgi:predicted ATP-grasp superfamily ATP-dependent carboligase